MPGDNYPAGGFLLHQILEKYLELYNQSLINEKINGEKVRKIIKDNILSTIIDNHDESTWRLYLWNSLDMADKILDNIYESLKNEDHGFDAVLKVSFILKAPGIVGTGSGLFRSVFEVGLSFDWLLGLPYYPASTVKGAVRSYSLKLLGDGNEDWLVDVFFGDSNEKGSSLISFFDMYPVGCDESTGHPCLILTGGIVNPHYYEGGEVVESETDANPTPIQHIVIAPGTVFRLVAGIRCPWKKDQEKLVIDTRSVERLVKKILGVDVKCGIKDGKCSCLYQYAVAVATLVVAAFRQGFAARSGKGYNVMDIFSGEPMRDVRSLALFIPAPNDDRHPPRGRRPGNRSFHGRRV